MILIKSYKCRHCGAILESSTKISNEIDLNNKDNIQILPNYNKITFHIDSWNQASCPMIIFHRCNSSGTQGIADLISVDSADDDLYKVGDENT